jgi:pyruvate dehydrogenase E1 component alpha subunit
LEKYLRATGELDDARAEEIAAEAEAFAASLRQRMNADVERRPGDLFTHVYTEPTANLAAQRAELEAELAEQDRS